MHFLRQSKIWGVGTIYSGAASAEDTVGLSVNFVSLAVGCSLVIFFLKNNPMNLQGKGEGGRSVVLSEGCLFFTREDVNGPDHPGGGHGGAGGPGSCRYDGGGHVPGRSSGR